MGANLVVDGFRVGDDDSGVVKNARMVYTPTAGGTFYVQVNDPRTLTGTYTLSVILLGANGASEADTDFPATTATTGRVEVGGSVTGEIDSDTDRDWFKVELEAGKTYQFDMEGQSHKRGIPTDRRYAAP